GDADILGVLSVRAGLTRVAGHQRVLAHPDPDPPQAALIPERPRQALRFAERWEELPKLAGPPVRVSKLEAQIDRLFLRLPRLRPSPASPASFAELTALVRNRPSLRGGRRVPLREPRPAGGTRPPFPSPRPGTRGARAARRARRGDRDGVPRSRPRSGHGG